MGIAIAIHDLIARDTWVGYLSRIVIRHREEIGQVSRDNSYEILLIVVVIYRLLIEPITSCSMSAFLFEMLVNKNC